MIKIYFVQRTDELLTLNWSHSVVDQFLMPTKLSTLADRGGGIGLDQGSYSKASCIFYIDHILFLFLILHVD